jgi:hypothetical protein
MEYHSETKQALNYFFEVCQAPALSLAYPISRSHKSSQVSTLDIYLPLLASPSAISTSVAGMLASTVRSQSHRSAVVDWLPPTDRAKEAKGKRGWEKPALHAAANAPARAGGWVARALTGWVRGNDGKVGMRDLFMKARTDIFMPFTMRE